MIAYQSKSGKPSGVTAYQPGADFILIKFGSGEIYRYSYQTAGKSAIEKMKKLASGQKGLSTFIAQNQPGYEK